MTISDYIFEREDNYVFFSEVGLSSGTIGQLNLLLCKEKMRVLCTYAILLSYA